MTAHRKKAGPNDRPTVSAVIPAHNAEETIERALASVYAQTYDSIIEVIVVDDGSEDTTAEIVREKYPDATLIQQENTGAAAARNAGIERATGEFIAFLDADDEWLPQKLVRQMQVIQAKPEVDFCGCLLEINTTDGRRRRPYPELRGETSRLSFLSFLRREHPPITVTPIGSRTALRSVDGFDPGMTAYNDLDLWLRVLGAGYQISILQEYIHRWYLQSESVSQGRRGLAQHDCMLRILEKWKPGEDMSPLEPDDYTAIKRRTLVGAARDHAYYGEYSEARRYAVRGLEKGGGPLRERLLLRLISGTPWAYRAWTMTARGLKGVLRGPVWWLRGLMDREARGQIDE